MAGAGDRRANTRVGKAIRRRDDFPEPPAAAGKPHGVGEAGANLADEDGFGPPARPRDHVASQRLADDDADRVPWLQPPDDGGDDDAVDGGRIVRFALLPLAAIALAGGAVWYVSHRVTGPGPADGSLIRAEPGPYKVRPESPGGETFAGTGDSSFAVSEGENRGARLAPAGAAAAPLAPEEAGGATEAAPAQHGVGVQVGAYMDAAAAEAGWTALVQRNPALGAFQHRVVEGRADIGRVFRLQAVTANVAAATALCASLTARGQGCQVKR